MLRETLYIIYTANLIVMPWNSWNIAKVDIKHQSINQSINCIKGNTFFHLTFHLSSLTWYIRYAWHLHFVLKSEGGLLWPWLYGSWIKKSNYLCNQCLSPLMLWVRIPIRTRCTTLCDKVCQWLATGRWFSPGPPVSSTNKTNSLMIYNWNIVESVLNTLKPNLTKSISGKGNLSQF